MKLCYKCKQYKALTDFSKHKNKKGGLKEECKACMSVYVSSVKGKSSRLFSSCKRRAALSGGSVTITRQWVEDKLEIGVCELTGLPFNFSGRGKFSRQPYAPSIDRKDPQNPDYTPENSRVVLWAINCAMAEYGEEIMIPIFKVLINAQTNTITSVSAGHYSKSEEHTKHGTLLATGFGEDDDNAYHHCGADAGQDFNHRAQESSGDGVAHRNKKVEPSSAFTRSEDHGQPSAEGSSSEVRGRPLFD